MATLHIIKQPTLNFQSELLTLDDGIVLLQDGVQLLKSMPTSHKIFCIDEHLEQRGLEINRDNLQVISMADFVSLCSSYKNTLSW